MKPIKDKFILLFMPQPSREGRRSAPLGLLAISTFLAQEGYDIRIFHSYDEDDYKEALNHLDQAICVGITAMTGYQIYDGLKFAELVRKINPQVPIVWGGVHPTICPAQTIEHPLVDIVVKGQGEDTFTELVHCLEKKAKLDDVLGITFKKDGKVINNPERPVKSIKEYPALPYYVLNESIERYIKKSPYAKRNLAYITSFGCPFRCAFCYLANNSFARQWDPYPAERVVDEIENLVKNYQLDGLDIRDANFFVNAERVKKIFQLLKERGIKIAVWGANGRAEQMIRYTDEEWELFREAGLKEILIGAESGDQEMLDLINKQSPVKATWECEALAKKHDINVINSFMTSFPPQIDKPKQIKLILKRELNQTVDLIRKIFKINPIANILLFFYTPYPGTPLYELAVRRGFKEPRNLVEWSEVDLSHRVTPWTSKKQISKVLLLSKLFILKKITSQEYVASKTSRKYRIIKFFGWQRLMGWWIDFRLKYKFYWLPWERIVFALNKIIK